MLRRFWRYLSRPLTEEEAAQWRASTGSTPPRPPNAFERAVGGFVGGVLGCAIALVVFLVGLVVLIWLIKRIWEAV